MAIEHVINGDVCVSTFFSLDELADAAESHGLKFWNGDRSAGQDDFYGGSLDKALSLAREGWAEQLAETLELAESAVEMAERELEVESFQPVWDVSGADVDVARYLSGEPENMIDYPMITSSKVGRVITLTAAIARSAVMSDETITRRGQVVVALALALTRLGHAVELWAEWRNVNRSGREVRVKVLVKGANDVLDPERVMFAYAHRAMSRRVCFAVGAGFPGRWRRNSNQMFSPRDPVEDYPEGTIYLGALRGGHDMPDAHTELRGYLGELGLLAN